MLSPSGFPAIDVAIGLTALFFLLSTVCSSINEGIASVLGWRGKTLEDAIRNMLGEPKARRGLMTAIGDAARNVRRRPARPIPDELTGRLFDHWRIKALVRNPDSSRRRRNRPSYLPPRAFSRALAEIVAVLPDQPLGTERPGPRSVNAQPGSEPSAAEPAQATPWQLTDEEMMKRVDVALATLPNAQLRALVGCAAVNAEQKLDDFRGHIETAFNDAMERASGWYKRKVQIVVAILASAIAIGLNVDTVRVATHLLNEGTVRAAVASQAAAIKQTPKDAANALDQVSQLKLPVGWGSNGPQGKEKEFSRLPGWVARRLPGWLLTIAALSLGAPFWFDLLSRLARLRGAGVSDKPRSLSDTAGARGT